MVLCIKDLIRFFFSLISHAWVPEKTSKLNNPYYGVTTLIIYKELYGKIMIILNFKKLCYLQNYYLFPQQWSNSFSASWSREIFQGGFDIGINEIVVYLESAL